MGRWGTHSLQINNGKEVVFIKSQGIVVEAGYSPQFPILFKEIYESRCRNGTRRRAKYELV